MKKDDIIIDEMRSLAPYFLTLGGIYLVVTAGLCCAFGGDISLPLGAVYGTVLSAANFFCLGKSAERAVKRPTEKSAQTYMNIMYCVRYMGLFALLTAAAFIPFINLIASVIPLFFVRIAITVREIIKERQERSEKKEE